MRLEGKACLVTGGTRGIGAAAAIALAEAGADVAINGRFDDEEARRTLCGIEALGRKGALVLADVGKPDEARRCVEETIARLGGIDVLVHSAGGLVPGGLFEVTPEAWHAGFDVHVHAVYHLARAAIPSMRARKEGAIVLIGSVAGRRGLKTNIAYQVVKGAVPGLARALAYEFADDNIRVNCVAPGIVRTRFHAGMTEEQKKYNLEARIPLHREGRPEDIATLIREIVANDYITGETFVIDGGLTMRIA
ncbi:MAG: SDR family oxidoreductase [Planctomycetes bacterium]|nr:SDR family oxidoreductase [Planctomycetota bacterium]